MELNEIVNPYFSFPVVGVVICAVLVYAFGFKAPVQPPSFDFDGDKKFSKKRKVSKKSLSNGNATSVLATTSPNLKSSVDVKLSKTSSPKARQISTAVSNSINSQLVVPKADKEQKVPTKGSVDKKSKKEKVVPNPIVQDEVAKPIPKVIEGRREDGEWVQTLSRKEKKNRKREENVDDFIKDSLITNYKDYITPTNSKENSPSKKKKTSNKNYINKAKVMKEKLDDNIKTPFLLKPIGENVSLVNDENKPEAKLTKGEPKENKLEKNENKVEKKENKPEKKPEIKEIKSGKENKSDKKENNLEKKDIKSEKKENKPEKKENKPEKIENKPEKKENKPEKKENKTEKKENKSEKKENKHEKKEIKSEKIELKSEKSEKDFKNEGAPIKSEAKSKNAINTNVEVQSVSKKAKNVDVPKSIPAAANEKANIKTGTSKVAKEEPLITTVVVDIKPELTNAAETQVGKVAFDELGDPWEETKSQKKKKKTRRDQ